MVHGTDVDHGNIKSHRIFNLANLINVVTAILANADVLKDKKATVWKTEGSNPEELNIYYHLPLLRCLNSHRYKSSDPFNGIYT